MVAHGIATSDNVGKVALNAGVDMDMASETYVNTLDKRQETVIDQACRRILEAKYKLGLFDDPYKR